MRKISSVLKQRAISLMEKSQKVCEGSEIFWMMRGCPLPSMRQFFVILPCPKNLGKPIFGTSSGNRRIVVPNISGPSWYILGCVRDCVAGLITIAP